MKKTNLLIFLAIALAAVLIFFLKSKEDNSTLEVEAFHFRITDTASIQKLFIATKAGQSDTLRRTKQGWKLNGKYLVNKNNINLIMEMLLKMRIKSPVGDKSKNGVVKAIATRHYKVEVYTTEGLLKSIFIGPSIQTGLGNYVVEEGSDDPYIVHIPGWNGNLGPRLKVNENQWRNTKLFAVRPAGIQQFTVEYQARPEHSFSIKVDEQGSVGIERVDETLPPLIEPDDQSAKEVLFNANKLHLKGFTKSPSAELIDSVRNVFPKVANMELVKKSGQKMLYTVVAKPLYINNTIEWSENDFYAFVPENEAHTLGVLQQQAAKKILRRFDMFEKSK